MSSSFEQRFSRALTKKGAVGMLFTCIVLCLVSANKEPEHFVTVLSPKIDVKQISVDTFAPNTKPSKSLRNEMDHGWRADRKHVIIGCSKLVRTHTHTHTHTNTQTQQLRAINNHTTTELCLDPRFDPGRTQTRTLIAAARRPVHALYLFNNRPPGGLLLTSSTPAGQITNHRRLQSDGSGDVTRRTCGTRTTQHNNAQHHGWAARKLFYSSVSTHTQQ